MRLFMSGELGRGGGWLGRARRLLEDEDWPVRGYLLLPEMFRKEAEGDIEGAARTAGRRLTSAAASATPTWSPSQRTRRDSS